MIHRDHSNACAVIYKLHYAFTFLCAITFTITNATPMNIDVHIISDNNILIPSFNMLEHR
jgi:hypothetical protein